MHPENRGIGYLSVAGLGDTQSNPGSYPQPEPKDSDSDIVLNRLLPWDHPQEHQTSIQGGTFIGGNVNHVHHYGELVAQRTGIIEWFSPINFFLQQADVLCALQAGTGGWLLAEPRFRAWESGVGGTLWCHGIRTHLLTLIRAPN
jgi:hypothetical protein